MARGGNVKMSQPVNKRAVWIVGAILFVAMALTVPVLYYMFVFGGIMTYATLWMMSLPIFSYPLEAMHDGPSIFIVLHLLVYGILYFSISATAAWFLCRCRLMVRAPIMAIILIALLRVSGLEIFGYINHGSGRDRPQNAYGMWAEVRDEISSSRVGMNEP